MKRIRLLHLYLGTFFAPAILFFTVTGALQTFSFHETTKGSAFQPPAWIVAAGVVHKKQGVSLAEPTPAVTDPQPNATPTPASEARPSSKPKVRLSWPLKWFVLFMSVGLVFTTLLGLYMAFKYNRGARLLVGLLVAGTALPLLLLYA